MEKTKTLRVTALQVDINWCYALKNLERIEHLIREAVESDVYVLPEMFATGFCMEPWVPGVSGMATSSLDWMRQVAGERNCAVCGSLAVFEDGKYYNRFYFVTPDEVYWYDKRHLFAYGGENRAYTAGTQRVVVTFRGWRLLLQVCYDLRFPVFARNRKDYDVILYVANWPHSRIGAWDVLLRARAVENQCYVVAANRVGADPHSLYSGHTVMLDAFGRTLADGEEGKESLVSATLDMDSLVAFRKKFPVLDDAD